MSAPGSLSKFRRFAYAARRSWETDEAYWFWKWGRWEWSAGLFHGFGLGFALYADELALTFGCIGFGATRKADDARN